MWRPEFWDEECLKIFMLKEESHYPEIWQQEIREGLAGRYCYEVYGGLLSYLLKEFGNQDARVLESYVFADKELEYLDSVGVVLKVEGELPTRFLHTGRSLQECYKVAQQDILEAGYTKTERLI